MYKQYFHFDELPFSIAPDPHFMFMSERHQEGLAHLLYGINMGGGFVALTGEVGTGKTTLCRCLLEQLPENLDIALILNPKLNALELLSTLCDELGIAYEKHWQTLKYFIDSINQHLLNAYSNGRRTVLLIDEAQNLSLEVLEQIRLLTNLETSKTKLLQIILVGQPELKELLNQQNLRQLNQRITARYHLLPLSITETRAYIQHRLLVCKGNPNLFTERAIRKIYQYSSGVPRIINIICDRALLGAYASNVTSITPAIINRAAHETLGISHLPHRLNAKLVLMLICSSAVLAYILYQNDSLTHATKLLSVKAASTPEIQTKVNRPPAVPNVPVTPPPVAQPAQESVATTSSDTSFKTWLNNPGLTLNASFLETLKIWKKPIPADNQIDCKKLILLGLHCLMDTAEWPELLKLDRPVILEFDLPSAEKRYALLIGVRKQQALIRADKDLSFPVSDILSLWNGHYLLPWQSTRPKMTNISPGEVSTNVVWLRQQLSAVLGKTSTSKQPLLFDDSLKNQVISFQHQQHLSADGVAGARTLIQLDNISGALNSPHLLLKE
ncbi:AAA family ATPase [Methylomonas sp. AM2-LC]|uniref:ExeA family protein n=1 Tax=Methylomonas sp. AM2-LC TaxID=3153301 RepID=UPI0032647B7F